MSLEIPKRALLVYDSLMEWEEDNGKFELTAMVTEEERVLMFFEIYKALKLQTVPKENTAAWDEFILDIILNFADEYGVITFKSAFKQADINDVTKRVSDKLKVDAKLERKYPDDIIRRRLNEFVEED